MFTLRKPSPCEIDRFIEASRRLPLSYTPSGLVQNPPGVYQLDELTETIGHGEEDFVRARGALAEWRHFQLGWLEIFPSGAPVTTGSVVAVVIRHFGIWSLNGCRVIATVEEGARFGFSYGTLTNHAERGEELFEVALNAQSREVTYRIRAASRPRAWPAYLGYPLARTLQARFRRESADAMRRIVATPLETT